MLILKKLKRINIKMNINKTEDDNTSKMKNIETKEKL